MWDWVTSFLKAQVSLPVLLWTESGPEQLTAHSVFQNTDPGPAVLRRHSSSDLSKQKFGTMPLVPIRGDESNSSMLSANQTLVRVSWTRTGLGSGFCLRLFSDLVSAEETSRPEDPLHVLREFLSVRSGCCCCSAGAILESELQGR